MFEPMLGVTFTPTRITASQKINVIPSRAELKVDCRVPPGSARPRFAAGIAECCPTRLSIDFTERAVGNRSPIESPLMDGISSWV